jgi:hypothetical protein
MAYSTWARGPIASRVHFVHRELSVDGHGRSYVPPRVQLSFADEDLGRTVHDRRRAAYAAAAAATANDHDTPTQLARPVLGS